MVKPRWAAKALMAGRKWWLQRKEWNFDNLTDPLMDETSNAAESSFPGTAGERESVWDDIPEATKDRAPDLLTGAAENYQSSLDLLENAERKRISLAERFIEQLPGGEIIDNRVLFIREVHEEPGGHNHPHTTAERGDFDSWLSASWSAFNDADDADQLLTEIENIASSQDTSVVDIDAIRHWENELGIFDWEEVFWDLYESGVLRSYHSTIEDIEIYKSETALYAKEMDETLRILN